MAGIYIHIPFCKKRCIYCDFYSVTDSERAERYVDSLIVEFENRINEIGKNNVSTIYIGGGTPSQLNTQLLGKLLSHIKQQIDFDKIKEFTIEVNPDDVTPELIGEYFQLGINRISMGIQSFNDKELEFLNRRHNAKTAIDAVNIIKDAGISNISIDLIYGIPGQTLQTWEVSIDSALALDVPHISCYNLSYEEGTKLYAMRKMNKVTELTDDECVAMYNMLATRLKENGYHHYEISNYAKPGKYAIHNTNYWNLTPYLGIGVSAHSFDGSVRRYNPYSLKDYFNRIEDKGCAYEEENETLWQQYNEYIMVGLRTMWGIDLDSANKLFGEKLCCHLKQKMEQFISEGLINYDNNRITITEKGIMLSDMVIRELMYVE